MRNTKLILSALLISLLFCLRLTACSDSSDKKDTSASVKATSHVATDDYGKAKKAPGRPIVLCPCCKPKWD